MTNEFQPIYEECDNEDCQGACIDPTHCKRKSPWSDRFKKFSFYTVILLALLLSIHKVYKNNLTDSSLVELPLLSANEASIPQIKSSVSFIYMPSNNESENLSIISSLDAAVEKIRNAGGGLVLHKLNRHHEHFELLSSIYQLKTFPVVLVFGPNCCSKYVLKTGFTVERFVSAYRLASSSDTQANSSNSSDCKDKKCK